MLIYPEDFKVAAKELFPEFDDLHRAIESGNYEVVEGLLEKKYYDARLALFDGRNYLVIPQNEEDTVQLNRAESIFKLCCRNTEIFLESF